jgi:hypothetical protein
MINQPEIENKRFLAGAGGYLARRPHGKLSY